ncbi:MAG TPA: SusC/RagA family TonB-linked outer membrane protein [Chitinophagaceae bacterium]
MKLSLVMLIISFHVSANGIAQKITLDLKNASLEKVFEAIGKQTSFDFIYNENTLKITKPVTINVKNAELSQVLELCFRDQPVKYTIAGLLITISPQFTAEESGKTIPLFDTHGRFLDIFGKITDTAGNLLSGVYIKAKGTKNETATNENGEFSLKGVDERAILVITSVGYETQEISLNGRIEIFIQLRIKVTELAGVGVTVRNGYQELDKTVAPGSFDYVSNQLINRKVTGNILSRIENLTSVSFNNANDGILIRGRSSIFSNVTPLIVLDNFPYDGNIDNINPNDVESITILKDATAASVWGARAGNGVIVITTKRGKTNKPRISVNTNMSFGERPNLSRMPIISSSDYIELEKYLFDKGRYTTDEMINSSNNGHPPFTPVIELLIAKRNGTISATEADNKINEFKNIDVRSDLEKYFYRTNIVQQHSINVSANTQYINYYFSGGYDRNVSELVGNASNRITFRTQNTFKVKERVYIDAGINFVQASSNLGSNTGASLNSGAGKGLYPYADLVSDNGEALRLVRNYRTLYIDTVKGPPLDWTYRPLDDIYNTETISKTRDYLITAGIRYKITSSLNVEFKYQYENAIITISNQSKVESFFARDLINKYYQPIATNKFPIPMGGILNSINSEIISHQGRGQLNYKKTFNQKHEIAAIGGWEIKDIRGSGYSNRFYGYIKEGSIVNGNLDFITKYKQFDNPASFVAIPGSSQSISGSLDRFISYYSNASYTYDNLCTFSGSIRHDAANLFGVKTNQKGVPLWSAGLATQINNFTFYKIHWLPYLKIRATYGYNGNFSRLASAYPTMTYSTTQTGALLGNLQSPPNEKLRWEQVRILNFGLDFAMQRNRISGTIEYFRKNSKDLIAPAPIDPTLGVFVNNASSFIGNVASMKGNGFEIELNSRNIDGVFKWRTNFIFSYTLNKVSEYLFPVSTMGSIYLNANQSITPIIGRPVYTMYSYQWAGLDLAGDPMGYVGKIQSKNYSLISSTTKLDSMVYNGPVQPPYFGAFRNTFEWKNVSLSLNISYKGGYYFRKTSVDYSSLFSSWTGHSDYILRWQNPGDEKFTNVPSLIYPSNNARDAFYAGSEVLVEKADHIRLEDIRLDYSITNNKRKKFSFSEMNIYMYLSNLNVLIWKINKSGLDPYNLSGTAKGKIISFGLSISF